MKQKSSVIAAVVFSLLISLLLIAVPAQATVPYGLSLETTDAYGAPLASFVKGEKFYVNIIAAELQSVAGCAFTLNYNASVLTAPVTDTDGLTSGIVSLFPFTFAKAGDPNDGAITMRENSSTTGKILFSGAAINTTTGGGLYATSTPGGIAPLFRVEFTVRADAPLGAGYAFSLSQTVLNNTDAGYPAEGAGVPVLVGAVPQSDTTNWGDLTGGAFPVLLANFASPAPAATFDVVFQHLYTVGGTVAYTPVTGHSKGYQSGNLMVAAYATSDTSFSTPIGVQSIAWPQGTGSTTFTLSVPDGSYYLAAFIDTNGNSSRDEWEPFGKYNSNIISISGAGDSTVRAFSIADPIDSASGEPEFYVKWKTDNVWTAIGSMVYDYDKDGYSNIQEYINRKVSPSLFNPSDKVNLDAQGGTGYNASTDSRVTAAAPWTPKDNLAYNMILSGIAYVGQGVVPAGEWIGAFGPGGDDDCRGIALIGDNGAYGMLIGSDSAGEKISFRLNDDPVLNAGETLSFVIDDNRSMNLHFGTRIQTVTIKAGWNWVSFNVHPSDTSFSEFFGSQNVDKIEQVKMQSTYYYAKIGGTWMGDSTLMSHVNEGKMYKIKATEQFELNVTGTPIPPETPITLKSGWTWVAYLPDVVLNATDVLGTAVWANLEQIKEQSLYYKMKVSEGVFTGNLENMTPNRGYLIKMGAETTLIYQTN
jgi:hypothetical protein